MHQIFSHYFFAHYHSIMHVLHAISFSRVTRITLRPTGHLPLSIGPFFPVFQTHLHGTGPILLASDPLGGN